MQTNKTLFRDFFAVKFKKYRFKHDLSQEQMAERLHISTRSYSDIERRIYGISAQTLVMYMLIISEDELQQLILDLRKLML